MMNRIFYLFFMTFVFIVWNKKSFAFRLKKVETESAKLTDNADTQAISFLNNNNKDAQSQEESTKEKEEDTEPNHEHEHEHEHEHSSADKMNAQKNGEEQKAEFPERNKITPLLGTHDNEGNFVPSYQLLSNEILSANNALERSSQFLKVACSHILKLLEFIPESKIDTYFVKLDSKDMYLKEIGVECHKLYFSVEKLSMSIIVLNSKLYKLIMSPTKK